MKHCLPDPEQAKEFGADFVVYSCEYESGKRCTGNEMFLRIGEDGKVMFLLCHSCLEQLRGQVIGEYLRPIFLEALQKDQSPLQKVLETIRIGKSEI